jgi:hypothetical protein
VSSGSLETRSSLALLRASVLVCPDGTRGFDTTERLTREMATVFFEHGYRYAVRYVRRDKAHPGKDLTADEAESLLEAGLGLMVVQYVESETAWVPNADKGAGNGKIAAEECARIGLPAGVSVWCDLEGVEQGTPAMDVIEYCSEWHEAVARAGYLPGLYVGWRCGLTPEQLYLELRFTNYWAAYNLNADEEPAVRGVQMKQVAATLEDRPAGVGIEFDTDVVRADRLGGRPSAVVTASWAQHPNL